VIAPRPVSFRDFTTPDSTLEELAETLRRSSRARAMARGLRIQDAFALLFTEAATKTGSR
jgi:hypothetical protein